MGFNNNHFTCVIGIPLDTDQKSHAKCFACIKAQVYTVFVEIHLKLNQTCTDSNVFMDTYTASMSEPL